MQAYTLDVPDRIETDRLLLRVPSHSGDGPIVNQAIRESINELKEWLPFAQSIPSVEQTEENQKKARIAFSKKESFRFLLFNKENNEFIGTCSIQAIDLKFAKAEIGYWIRTSFSGNGFMTEAIQALTDFGLTELRLKRIEIRCDTTNKKSRAIPERLGYELESIIENDDMTADGRKLKDTCVYVRIQ